MLLLLAGWQNNLQQLQQPQHVLPKAKQPRQAPTAQRMQPSASTSRRQDNDDSLDPEEMTVPFDGTHLLECYGMTQYDSVLSLEKFLQQLHWSSVAPVVRCARPWAADSCCMLTCVLRQD